MSSAAALGVVALLAHAGCDPDLGYLSSGDPASPDDAGGSDDTSADANGRTDAKNDGGGDGASCRAAGSFCSKSSDCCGACTDARKCADSCIAEGAGGCNVSGGTCCVSTFCSEVSGQTCKACLPNGSTPENVGGSPSPASCCSRKTQQGKCASDD